MTQVAPQPENQAKLAFLVRGEKVLPDADLAHLTTCQPKPSIRRVQRTLDRFPAHVIFQLTLEEWEGMRS